MSIGIRLVFNWHQFGFRFVSDWLFIWFKLVVDWHSIGCQFAFNLVLIVFKLVVNWHLIGCQYAFDWEPISIPLAVHWNPIFISSCIALVLQLHPNVCQLADYHWIGKLQIWPTKKIWLNLGLLIGRELRILASHWSRGPSENFQRGYPYDPESLPIECFRPQLELDWFISDKMDVNFHWLF